MGEEPDFASFELKLVEFVNKNMGTHSRASCNVRVELLGAGGGGGSRVGVVGAASAEVVSTEEPRRSLLRRKPQESV